MGLVNATEREQKILEAARAYADALAVLRGDPPFSAWDAAKIECSRNQLLAEAMLLAGERQPGPSIPADATAPPDLVRLMERFMPRTRHECARH
jgi:hypothetical protein